MSSRNSNLSHVLSMSCTPAQIRKLDQRHVQSLVKEFSTNTPAELELTVVEDRGVQSSCPIAAALWFTAWGMDWDMGTKGGGVEWLLLSSGLCRGHDTLVISLLPVVPSLPLCLS